jgi:DNA-binding response OmpR family regulator
VKILFVENHAVFAKTVISEFLAAHEVTVVPSLSQGRRSISTNKYDLILLDYDLDDGKGSELAVEIRISNPKLPVIGVSSHQQGNEALLKAGANAICSKMDFDRIEGIIDEVTKQG